MGEKRFEKVYSQGMVEVTEIWVDQYTGVNYYPSSGLGGQGGHHPGDRGGAGPESLSTMVISPPDVGRFDTIFHKNF